MPRGAEGAKMLQVLFPHQLIATMAQGEEAGARLYVSIGEKKKGEAPPDIPRQSERNTRQQE